MKPRSILALAALGVVLYAYPGLLSYDSAFQLDEARRWEFSDWHPPAMGALWRGVELFVSGPLGMLLLQTVALVAGLHALLASELASRRAAIVTLAICWFPPVFTILGVIWKDNQMAAYALLGFAALRSTQPRIRWLGLGLLVVAGAMRHNAPAATFLPVLLFWGPHLAAGVRRYATAAGVWLAITLVSLGLNAALTTRHEHLWSTTLAVTDIAGTIRWMPETSDEELRADLAGTPMRVERDVQAAFVKHYEPRGYAIYYQFDPPLAMPGTEAERDAITRAWQRIVLHHPLAYLRHRWSVFGRVIELGKPRVPPLTTTYTYDGDPELAKRIGQDGKAAPLHTAMLALARSISGIWYAPLAYLLVALALVPLARRQPVALALLGSGLGYELGLFFLAPTPDVRYSSYLMLTTLVAYTLVLVRRAKSGAPRDAAPTPALKPAG